MPVIVHLPQNVEQAYVAAARTKGGSVDALVAEVLVLQAPVGESANHPERVEEQGIPVPRTGQSIELPRPGASV